MRDLGETTGVCSATSEDTCQLLAVECQELWSPSDVYMAKKIPPYKASETCQMGSSHRAPGFRQILEGNWETTGTESWSFHTQQVLNDSPAASFLIVTCHPVQITSLNDATGQDRTDAACMSRLLCKGRVALGTLTAEPLFQWGCLSPCELRLAEQL